jgi:nitroimidazol reductase NimA-like FMN-containing flavoprotein (pyridoxamine 5'-phosphate oxidase superfamily)
MAQPRGVRVTAPPEGGQPVYDGRTGLELLPPAECWRLLGAARFGRVGLVVDGEPVILPVNHAVDGRAVVFRTAGGTKLSTMTSWPTVAFEADGADADGLAWSVLVSGRAERVTDGAEVRALDALELHTWAPGHKLHWVRIVPRRVTGRRLPGPAS